MAHAGLCKEEEATPKVCQPSLSIPHVLQRQQPVHNTQPSPTARLTSLCLLPEDPKALGTCQGAGASSFRSSTHCTAGNTVAQSD